MLTQAYRAMLLLAAVLAVAAVACGGGAEKGDIILATTTSTDDSGLLDVLVPVFQEETGYGVDIIAVGSGQALEMGSRGDADALLTHAPSGEEELVASGDAVNRQLVMHNDFVILGPEDDPAGVGDAPDAVAALETIAEAEATFISRGDDSGTHRLELSLWDEVGIEPAGEGWYEESGLGMGQTLQIANQRDAYTISDRATFLALGENLDLVVVLEGDPRLLNIYHVMQVNPERHDRVNADGARAFVEFMVSDRAQELIGEFGVEEFGEPLFVPDAGKTEEELGLP
jgi:tungstate transport system substrate-binding protein